MLKNIKESNLERELKRLKPDKARIAEIVRKLDIPPERVCAIDHEVEKLWLAISLAALNDNPDRTRNAGTKNSLIEIERAIDVFHDLAHALGGFHAEATAAFVQAIAAAPKETPPLHRFETHLIRINSAACRAHENIKSSPPTTATRGRNKKTVAADIAKATALAYRELTGDEPTRIVGTKPGEHSVKDDRGYGQLLLQIFEELGLDASVDNQSRGRGRKPGAQ